MSKSPSDTVTVQLMNPRGWIYVDHLSLLKWGWEARLGGWHLDAGICRTKRGALNAARRAVKEKIRERDE